MRIVIGVAQKMNSIRIGLISATVILGAAAFGQSRNAFLDVQGFEDVFVQPSNGGLTYQISLGPSPAMVFDNQALPITDIFGFFVLSNDDDLVPIHSDTGDWRAVENQAGIGGVAGWKTQPNNGLQPNESFSFTFQSLNAASIEQVGYHVRLTENFPGTGGNTGFATVPEPASLGVLLIGALSLLRRRKRRV